ncbi:dCTP deaminase/dUTPase family protein [Limosilactobacillus difficilis]|uniref:dUTP diphosphatase n=1 Tax=Limosilactobacillus difficilis TaxID=2991838 RepID=UPI0024BA24E4|nr:dUTP diphosphatase [Limosilactobacillus difficilis]
MKRGFEIVSSKKNENLQLPQRQTKNAAGYDLAASEDFTLPSIWKGPFLKTLWALRHQQELTDADYEAANQVLKPYLVPTGIKAYMQADEFILLANRSSAPLKRRLILPNGVGIIDADYYNNAANEGELFVQLVNYGLRDYTIKKGERIGQAIFMSYLKSDDEAQPQAKRIGGFGSTKK